MIDAGNLNCSANYLLRGNATMVLTRNIALCCLVICCCSCSVFSKPGHNVVSQVQPNSAVQPPNAAGLKQNVTDATQKTPSSEQSTDIGTKDGAIVSYKKDELCFSIKADHQLNKYKNDSHALFLCIYQLKDPNGFNQQAEERDGIAKLLECTRFDASVANSKRIVVQPGQEIHELRDRAEGARFIGVATGYYGAEKVTATQLKAIPLERQPLQGLKIDIALGPYEIEKVTVK
jgi:type VI secretion system VasD/TssJ family lipoprotein